jgi:hypothetical protein
MNELIIYSTDDGVAIISPAVSIELAIKDVPEGKEYHIINLADVPAYTFRNAWELVDGKIVVNEAKKQAILDAQQAPILAKQSAIAKLTKLGLTEDEIKAMLG